MFEIIEELFGIPEDVAFFLIFFGLAMGIIVAIFYAAMWNLRKLRTKVHSLKDRHGLVVSEVIRLLGPPQERTQQDENGDMFLTWRIDNGVVDYQNESSFEGGSTQVSGQIKGYYSATLRFSQGRFVEIYREESAGF